MGHAAAVKCIVDCCGSLALMAMAPCQTLYSRFLATLRFGRSAVPAARGAALGCAARVTWQKRDMTDLALPLPCVPGALSQAADSRECLARNAEHAGRLSCKGALDRMSPSAERALLPASRGEDDERAPVPTALLIYPNIRSVAAQRTTNHRRAAFARRWRD